MAKKMKEREEFLPTKNRMARKEVETAGMARGLPFFSYPLVCSRIYVHEIF